jgi:hypothetical protein
LSPFRGDPAFACSTSASSSIFGTARTRRITALKCANSGVRSNAPAFITSRGCGVSVSRVPDANSSSRDAPIRSQRFLNRIQVFRQATCLGKRHDRFRVRRFFSNCVSFSEDGNAVEQLDTDFLRHRDGSRSCCKSLFRRLYDKVGFSILIVVFLISSFFTPLVFFGGATWVIVGMALWGINKGAQDTLFKPAISGLIAPDRRSTAFGIFDAGFGVAWLVGSITFGLLYDKSLPPLVVVSALGQLVSLPIFFLAKRASER